MGFNISKAAKKPKKTQQDFFSDIELFTRKI